jgi:acetolactate synthase-1/2/3 large subunit
MPTGAELFVDTAKRLGIRHIFTLVGDHLNEVLAVAAREGMTIFDMRHESGVTHAADAWARLHRTPALSLVTGGPGHTNSLTGIATAQAACSPLIAVSGAPATAMRNRIVFQDMDQVGTAAPIAKWAAAPSTAAQIPFYLGNAFMEAASGRMGATHLTIPVDLFTASTDKPLAIPISPADHSMPPASNCIDDALRLLRAAERPVVISGSGVWWGDAGQELDAFLRKTKLPYYSITMARGVIPDAHPYAMGYADPALNKAVHKAFQAADVVLVLGKRIDYRLAMGSARLFSPAAKFIQVDFHKQELGHNRNLEVGICAGVRETLNAFNTSLGNEEWAQSEWLRLNTKWSLEAADALVSLAIRERDASPIHPASFFHEWRKHVPENQLYSWDGGDFVHWGRAMIPALRAGGWLRLGPMGTIGSALPNALAMQLANPDEKVVMVTGDGSLGFYIAELDTAVRHNLPVIVVVGNDAGWGLERELQSALTGAESTVACELRGTRYDLVMKGFGGDGETVDRLDQIGGAVTRAFQSAKPYLLNVNIRGSRSPFTEWQIAGKK